jgi:hypothetical protein
MHAKTNKWYVNCSQNCISLKDTCSYEKSIIRKFKFSAHTVDSSQNQLQIENVTNEAGIGMYHLKFPFNVEYRLIC